MLLLVLLLITAIGLRNAMMIDYSIFRVCDFLFSVAGRLRLFAVLYRLKSHYEYFARAMYSINERVTWPFQRLVSKINPRQPKLDFTELLPSAQRAGGYAEMRGMCGRSSR